MKQLWMLCLAFVPLAAHAQTPEVAVVEGTFTIQKSASEGSAAAQFCDKVETALKRATISFSLLTEEQVEQGALAGHKVAIFPYSANWSSAETDKLAEFLKGGGKAFVFYTVPGPICDLIGVKVVGSRRQDAEGQFAQMRFSSERPAGFPSIVNQTSRNLLVCEPVGGAVEIARWYSATGEDSGAPAVILSERGVYMSHVLHEGDAGQQAQFVLAAVGHFLPHLWETAVQGAIASVTATAEVETLEGLREVAAGHPAAEALAEKVAAGIEDARNKLADKQYEAALNAARSASDLAADCVAATYGSRDGELRGVWSGGAPGTDWEEVMSSLQAAGLNAIFPNMCSASVAYYDSDVLPRAGGRDELAACLEAAKRHGIEVHVWRVNWCMLGGGAEIRDKFLAEGRCMVSVTGKPMTEDPATGSSLWMCPSHEGNREIEKQAMLELTRKYHPAGIHFDYMRFPSRDYCYCDRCRAKFEEAYNVKVGAWPADCFAGGALFDDFKQFRKDLQTSLVREIAQESRAIDPNVKISLAARSALPGAPENDGQDWPTWCKERLLDFVCPMDYSGDNDDRLRKWLGTQVPALEGSVPLYAGLGVTYNANSLSTAVRASRQVSISREQGADGFVIFSLNTVCRQMMRGLKLGATSVPVTMMPHHYPEVRVSVQMPEAPAGLPPSTWAMGDSFQAQLCVTAPAGIEQLNVRCDLCTTEGQVIEAGRYASGKAAAWDQIVTGGAEAPGVYQWVLLGEFMYKDGNERPFILRTTPWRVIDTAEAETLRARASAPRFDTTGLHVGVLSDGYGSEGILKALAGVAGVEAKTVYKLDAANLAACRVLILPQRQAAGAPEYGAALGAVTDFVRRGGGLLVTHDAVGARQHPAPFADVCAGVGPVKLTEARVAADHPITAGLQLGQAVPHSYYDHIALKPGEGAAAILDDAEGNPVLVAGEVGEGRFVANGMCTGLGPGDAETPPTGAELTVLINAVRWLGAQ